jgi:hypothetical protein
MTDHLECGGLVMFPLAPIPLPADEDVRFLQEVTPPFHTRKNVSWYPGSGHVSGLRAPDAVTDRVRRILSEHHGRVEQLLRRIIPTFTPGWITGTSSLRAFQEKERDIPLRQRSDLIHLDAGAYGATHGHLILRFLTNLDDQDRVWRVKGTAPDIVERLGTDAGLAGQDPVSEGLFDRFVSGLIRVPSSAFPMLRTLDTSPYDRAMRRIHNRMKESVAFQSDPEGAADVHFKPRSCWMVFADMTGHACLSGKLALIDTFLIPRENFADVARTPYEILRRFGAGGAGRARTKVVVTEGASQGRAIS